MSKPLKLVYNIEVTKMPDKDIEYFIEQLQKKLAIPPHRMEVTPISNQDRLRLYNSRLKRALDNGYYLFALTHLSCAMHIHREIILEKYCNG